METRGRYDIGRRQSALMEGRSDERAIASGFCEASEIIQAPDAPACDACGYTGGHDPDCPNKAVS